MMTVMPSQVKRLEREREEERGARMAAEGGWEEEKGRVEELGNQVMSLSSLLDDRQTSQCRARLLALLMT